MSRRKATAAQIAANRANAQKSTGPKDPAMKQKVALNALKHGLCGNFHVLSCEDQAEYDDLFRRFIEAEKPVDDVERELVAKMARHTWLSDRAQRIQDGCFLVFPPTPECEANRQDEIAVRKDIDKYLRYQSHQDRAYQRAASELAKRRAERRKEQIGFESQKRREAEEARRIRQEERRDAKENRQVEVHKYAIAYRAERLENEIRRGRNLKRAAAGAGSASPTPQLVEIEPSAA